MSVEELREYGLERMDHDAIRKFLSSQSEGVLGLPTEEAPYLLPMSYAFDGDSSLYFTYLLGSSSQKQSLSERTDHARFLVYTVETMFNWQSVMLVGELRAVPDEEYSELDDMLQNAWRPELFRTAGASGQVRVYEFDIKGQSGMRHTGLASGFREGTEP